MLTHCEAIVVSDCHIGDRFCRKEALFDTLADIRCDGPFIIAGDLWHRPWFAHEVDPELDLCLRSMVAKKKVLVPGNHDRWFVQYPQSPEEWMEGVRHLIPRAEELGLELRQHYLWEVEKKRYAVVHGDQFDSCVNNMPFLTQALSVAYEKARQLDRHGNFRRAAIDLAHKYSARLREIKEAAADFARQCKAHGLLYGHHHKAGEEYADHATEVINLGGWHVEPAGTAVLTDAGWELKFV